MNRFYFFVFIVITLILCNNYANSQQTGSFDTYIQFNGSSRMLSFYVPTDYVSTTQYQIMICLHGSGDYSNNFRNAIIQSLRWQNFITNTIFVCPEGNATTRQFLDQPGDNAIIDSIISYTKSLYSIDEKQVILEGFSLGGRSALKIGLDYPDKFKGLLLNTPAIQCKMDIDNVPSSLSPIYKYKNGSKLPIALTYGTVDQSYYHMGDSLAKKLSDNNTPLLAFPVVNMPHTIPGTAIIQQCMNFLNQPVYDGTDASIYNILIPAIIYDLKTKPLFRLVNYGTETITSADVTYNINGTDEQFSWNGTLATLEHADIELPTTCQENRNTLSVTLVNINGNTAISSLAQKSASVVFHCIIQSIALPIEFGFEMTEPTLPFWSTRQSGGMWSWMLDTSGKGTEGRNVFYIYNVPSMNLNRGYSEDLTSPVLDLSSVNNPCIAFDFAFNYIYLTPPSYNNYYTFTDTLNILMSIDSGKTYNKIYSKTGKDLATVTPPISNTSSYFVPQSKSQWRKNETIKLNDYKTATKAFFTFQYVSGMGGTLWLDNIRFMSFDVLAGPVIECSESTLNFDTTNIVTQKTISFEVTNAGKTDLIIDSVQIKNDSHDVFKSNVTSKNITIKPDSNFIVEVTFNPKSEISYSAQLIIYWNDTTNPSMTIGLSGKGYQLKPIITSNLTEWDYGEVSCDDFDKKTFRIKNTGDQNLIISNIVVENVPDGIFALPVINFPKTIGPLNTYSLEITFTPKDPIEYHGKIKIISDATNSPDFYIDVSGKGLPLSSVDEQTEGQDLTIKIQPNPVQEFATVTFNYHGYLTGKFQLQLVDINGVIVKDLTNNITNVGENKVEFTTENISSGKYFLISKLGNRVWKKSLVITK